MRRVILSQLLIENSRMQAWQAAAINLGIDEGAMQAPQRASIPGSELKDLIGIALPAACIASLLEHLSMHQLRFDYIN